MVAKLYFHTIKCRDYIVEQKFRDNKIQPIHSSIFQIFTSDHNCVTSAGYLRKTIGELPDLKHYNDGR